MWMEAIWGASGGVGGDIVRVVIVAGEVALLGLGFGWFGLVRYR